jgi:hypothetical protein
MPALCRRQPAVSTTVKSGGSMDFSPSLDALGTQLQVQTNAFTTGLGPNWFV